jgi:hypothetical protein
MKVYKIKQEHHENLTVLFAKHVYHGVNSVLLQYEALHTANKVEGPKAVRHTKIVDFMVLVEVVTVVADVFLSSGKQTGCEALGTCSNLMLTLHIFDWVF